MTQIIGAGSKMLIQQVVDEYGISRPTIMKALKAGQLSGQQDRTTKRWYIEPSEAQRWISTKKRRKLPVSASPTAAVAPDQSVLVNMLKEQVEQLKEQIDVKDEQIGKAQNTIDKQTLLIEHQQDDSLKEQVNQLNQQLKSQMDQQKEQVEQITEQLKDQQNKGFLQRLYREFFQLKR